MFHNSYSSSLWIQRICSVLSSKFRNSLHSLFIYVFLFEKSFLWFVFMLYKWNIYFYVFQIVYVWNSYWNIYVYYLFCVLLNYPIVFDCRLLRISIHELLSSTNRQNHPFSLNLNASLLFFSSNLSCQSFTEEEKEVGIMSWKRWFNG